MRETPKAPPTKSRPKGARRPGSTAPGTVTTTEMSGATPHPTRLEKKKRTDEENVSPPAKWAIRSQVPNRRAQARGRRDAVHRLDVGGASRASRYSRALESESRGREPGAWPFLVGGAICLVNSVNERDLGLLNSYADPAIQNPAAGELGPAPGGGEGRRGGDPSRPPPPRRRGAPPRRAVGSAATLLRGTAGIQPTEARGNNRSVMPLHLGGRALGQKPLSESGGQKEGGGEGRTCLFCVCFSFSPLLCSFLWRRHQTAGTP